MYMSWKNNCSGISGDISNTYGDICILKKSQCPWSVNCFLVNKHKEGRKK